jgi:membrane fusion protein (multidrug efflux system)
MTFSGFSLRPLCFLAFLTIAGCDNGTPVEQSTPPAPHVTVELVKLQPLSIAADLNGRLVAPRVAEVRARVAGVLLQRVYREGSQVKQGDVLFRIDPAPFQAEVDSAAAALEKAQANRYQARLQAERYSALIKTHAVSQQDYENARATHLQAGADVAAAEAALKRARLSLGYATVKAPISGRIGKALVTEGALVGQDSATPLAIIQQLEPIYADVTQSTRQITALRRALREGQLQTVQDDQAAVTLIQEDGTVYPLGGKLLFSDLTVDQSTGQITLRSQFPNPQTELLPGSFVRVRLEQARNERGISIPQRAVQRDTAGQATVLIVNTQDQVEQKTVRLGGVQNDRWIVEEGLHEGDRVIVGGLQAIQPGMSVEAQEAGPSDSVSPEAGSQ